MGRRTTEWVSVYDMMGEIEKALPFVGEIQTNDEALLNHRRVKAKAALRQLRRWFEKSGNADAQLEVNLVYPASAE